jgi:hypothetical protein
MAPPAVPPEFLAAEEGDAVLHPVNSDHGCQEGKISLHRDGCRQFQRSLGKVDDNHDSSFPAAHGYWPLPWFCLWSSFVCSLSRKSQLDENHKLCTKPVLVECIFLIFFLYPDLLPLPRPSTPTTLRLPFDTLPTMATLIYLPPRLFCSWQHGFFRASSRGCDQPRNSTSR